MDGTLVPYEEVEDAHIFPWGFNSQIKLASRHKWRIWRLPLVIAPQGLPMIKAAISGEAPSAAPPALVV